MSSEARWTEVRTVADITDEVREIVQSTVEGWYPSGRIEWNDLWDRIESVPLDDGTKPSLPGDLSSPVFKELKKIAKEAQAE